MTFLEIAQKVARESGITTTGPTNVNGQVGALQKVIYWVLDATQEILDECPHWRFLWSQATSFCSAGQKVYSLADLEITNIDSGGISAIDKLFVNGREATKVLWGNWSEGYRNGTAAASAPSFYTVSPDNKIHFYPSPASNHRVDIDYYRKASLPVESEDVPEIPVEYHLAIVHKALVLYAIHEDDDMRYQQASIEYERWLGKLTRDYAPEITL